jgi:hypothetical protein
MISQATTQRLTTTLAIKKKSGYLSLKHKKKSFVTRRKDCHGTRMQLKSYELKIRISITIYNGW